MKRNLTIIIIGLLLFSYGHLMMPAMVEEESCVGLPDPEEGCPEGAMIEGEVENENRPFVIWGGGIIAVAGGFLAIGD